MNVDLFTFLLELLVFVLFIAASAFFSSAEMALFSLSHAKVMSFKNNAVPARRRIFDLMGDYHRTLITIILGNMFVNSCISMLNDELLRRLHLSPLQTTVLAGITGILLLLLFGEISPMTLAYAHCEYWSERISIPIFWFRRLLRPVTSVVGYLCDRVLDLLGRRTSAPLTDDEYLSWLDDCDRQGIFPHREIALLKETFALRLNTVESIMRSRVDLAFANSSLPAARLAELIRSSRQAYIPVGPGSQLDSADAIVSSLDFFRLPPAERESWAVRPCTQKAVFLPELSTLSKALRTLHEKNVKAVLAADEYGGVAGMLTIEDIYSELAGRSVEVNDEADWQFLRLSPDSWVFDGVVSAEFVRANSNWKTCNIQNEFESGTLSGIFCEAFGSLPQVNDTIRIGNVELKALSVSRNRITKVQFRIEPPVSAAGMGQGEVFA